MIELLAPAGDLEKLKFAYIYGADAVYIGGQNYSLRANAKNFSLNDIKEATRFAHSLKKKLYVTVNIVFHDEDFEGLEDYLWKLSDLKVDAVIVSDVAVMMLIKRKNIPIELHVSTQASIINSGAALFYKSLGATRLVLGREASMEDIKSIKEETGLEIECFVHGAMCTSISGRCVISNLLTLRDANRGGCAQICRWTFDCEGRDFSMTSKDLNMVSVLKEMMLSGVNSFKVEGRMRGIYYIATVIHAYRNMLDKVKNNSLTKEDATYYLRVLNRVANRESAPQFFHGLPHETEQYFLGREEVSNQDFLGLVIDYSDGYATIETKNYFKVGDKVEFFGPKTNTFSLVISDIKTLDGESLEVSNHPNNTLKIPCNNRVYKYDMMRLKVFDK